MNNSTISITSTSLHFREGNSDNAAGALRPYEKSARRVHTGIAREGNEYHATVEPEGEGYIVTFVQEKHDGRRLMVRKKGGEITGINRRGLLIPIPEPIRHAFEELPVDVLIDGEAVGDTLHAFDLLEVKGHDIRGNAYLSRFAGLITLLDPEHKHLRPVNTHMEAEEKRAMFETFRRCGSEGVVFKEIDAPFSPGRPNSGGSQMKFKFVESASFIVTGINTKRSVNLGLMASDGNGIVPAGSVTIPPNQRIPEAGRVVEVRYLYAFRESGSIYQPAYLGERADIPASDCTADQLKYKAQAQAA